MILLKGKKGVHITTDSKTYGTKHIYLLVHIHLHTSIRCVRKGKHYWSVEFKF